MKTEKISIQVSDSVGAVTGEILAPEDMTCLYVFAHGAGAGMNHPFMTRLSEALGALNIGTMRYNFPYMEAGGKRPDAPAVAEKAVIRAIETASERFPGTPLLAGGKSFGGRMTSQAMSKVAKPPLKGIVFVGFPLHAAGNPGTERANHLKDVTVPMLFLQGTRDALADIVLIEKICNNLPKAMLHKFEGADHSFRAGKQDLIPALAEAIRDWSQRIVADHQTKV
jgi:predicted alpha/beta-hydrolase family hydrolase